MTLPLTMPGIIAAAILTFIPAIGDYVTPGPARRRPDDDDRQGRPGRSSSSARDWPSGAALGFLLMLVTIIGTLLSAAHRCGARCSVMVRREPRNRWLTAYARRWSTSFLFLPIVDPDPVLVQRRRSTTSPGPRFTLDWYPRLFGNRDLLAALIGDAPGRARGGHRRRRSWARCSGLGLARLRNRNRGSAETLLLLPMVTPEIVMGISLLLFFGRCSTAQGSIAQISIAHITFCISYVAVVVRARAASLDPQLEEAARDLGASAWGAFRYVTLPLLAPAIAAGAMLAFALSFDDLVITTFNAGVGSSTLPIYIYSQDPVRRDAGDQRDLDDHRRRDGDRDPHRLAAGRAARRPAAAAADRDLSPGRPVRLRGGRRSLRSLGERVRAVGRSRHSWSGAWAAGCRSARGPRAGSSTPSLGVAVDDHQVERLDRRLLVRVAAGDPAARRASRAAGARTRASPGGW